MAALFRHGMQADRKLAEAVLKNMQVWVQSVAPEQGHHWRPEYSLILRV